MRGRFGLDMFLRFAYPPNSLGYCGPSDPQLLLEVVNGGKDAADEIRHLAPAFAGAWPYLQLIGLSARLDPLDARVVEAYWIGNPLLDRVDLLEMGNSVDDRFRRRAGWDWDQVAGALIGGGRPTHSFHVFCIYPWVGLLRAGTGDRALEVLDRCRVRWGAVVGEADGSLLVESSPLVWDGRRLDVGPTRVEAVSPPLGAGEIGVGDLVAMHWDFVCQRITSRQEQELHRYHELHLAIANSSPAMVGSKLER